MPNSAPSPRQPPRRHSALRLSVFRAVEQLAAWCGGRAWYRHEYLAQGRFDVREETIAIAGLARGLEGFTIAQLSDIHGGSFLASGDLAAVVAAVNARAPDVVAITGDFISHHWTDALGPLDDLARLSARHGVYAVFGNHDYKDRQEGAIVEAYAQRGLRFLRNTVVRIEREGGALALVGLEDLEEAKAVDPTAARVLVRPGDVEVVLCHNPIGARVLARAGCAAVLSGHTHGTQIDLPFLRRLGPKHPGLRVRLSETTLVVSRGLGVVGLPLRIHARPEVVLVRLVRAPCSPEDSRDAG